jgi:hypothetical protein
MPFHILPWSFQRPHLHEHIGEEESHRHLPDRIMHRTAQMELAG